MLLAENIATERHKMKNFILKFDQHTILIRIKLLAFKYLYDVNSIKKNGSAKEIYSHWKS